MAKKQTTAPVTGACYKHTPGEHGYIVNLAAGEDVFVIDEPQAANEVTPADAERLLAAGILRAVEVSSNE
jgi:hypothetical protein